MRAGYEADTLMNTNQNTKLLDAALCLGVL